MSEQQSAFSTTSPGLTQQGSDLVGRRPDGAAAHATLLVTAGPASAEGS